MSLPRRTLRLALLAMAISAPVVAYFADTLLDKTGFALATALWSGGLISVFCVTLFLASSRE